MGDEFRGTIAGCTGGVAPDGSPVHEPESVWVVDLGDNDESNKAGVLEFIGKHLGCGGLTAQSFTGEFGDFESRSSALATPT